MGVILAIPAPRPTGIKEQGAGYLGDPAVVVGKAEVGFALIYPENFMGRAQLEEKTWSRRSGLDDQAGNAEEDSGGGFLIKDK